MEPLDIERHLQSISAVLVFFGVSIATYEVLSLGRSVRQYNIASEVSEHPLLRMIAPMLYALAPLNSLIRIPRYRETLETKFRRAGGAGGMTVDMFLAGKELSAATTALFWILLFGWPTTGAGTAIFVVVAVAGWSVPNLVLTGHIAERQRNIVRELPYVLDLLTVSVEAGLDFMQAIERVTLVLKQGELTRELAVMYKGLQMGDSRSKALRQLAYRTEVPEVKTVVSALCQADQLGTGIGMALRTVSSQARVQRSQRAEKLAGEATVKLLFPLVLVFVAVMLMVLGPVAIQILMTLRSQ